MKRIVNRARKVNKRKGKAPKSVRLMDDRLNLLERLGRLLNPELSKDIVGSIVARGIGLTEALRQISQGRVVPPPIIPVPDAETLKEFLKNARKAYRKQHPPGKRGPKFAEAEALVWIARLEHKLNRQPSRKEIIAGVTNKDRYGSNPLSPRTAEKIVKLYRQLTRYNWYSRTGQALSEEDVRWLRKNIRPNDRSLRNWWTQILEQWQHAKLRAIGLSTEIHDAFTLSADDLASERKKLEALRIQHTFGKL